MSKTALLNLLTGETNEPATIELTGDRIAIGRAVTNDVMINSAHVSRKHVVFMYESNKWMMKDLSTNGVSLNSRKLPKDQFVALNNADKIALVPTGALQYQFQYVPPPNFAARRQAETVDLSPNHSNNPWCVGANTDDVIPNLSASNSENTITSRLVPDNKSSQYKNLWKRPHKVEIDSSDSDEPKESKKLRIKSEMDCSESSDSDDSNNIRSRMKLFMPPTKFNPLVKFDIKKTSTEPSSSSSDCFPRVKDEGGSESSKSDSKRRSREQLSSLKRKVQRLESENTMLTKKCHRVEAENQSLKTASQSEKQLIFDTIMDCFGTEFSCSICTEVFIDPTVLNCGHTFCSFCIKQWLKEKTVCAICRKQVTSQSKHVETNNLLVSIWSKMPQAIQFKRQNDMRDREEAVQAAQLRARAEANRPRPTATLGRGAYIPEENFVSFLLSRHFFAQVVDGGERDRPVTVSLRAGRILSSRPSSPSVSPPSPPRPNSPPRRRSARIQVRNQASENTSSRN